MINYPNTLTLEVLEKKHPIYESIVPELKTIDLLTSGGYRLRKAIKEFLPQRVGEDGLIYSQRLKKFSYRNILGNAIRTQANRIQNGTITVDGINSSNEDSWKSFRENTDGKGRTEGTLVGELFSKTARFKTVYVHVDKPKSEIIPRNKLEEELLTQPPKLVLYDASEVIHYDDNGEWIKVRQLTLDTSSPFSEPVVLATWTFIDRYNVARYSAYVELNNQLEPVKILNSESQSAALEGEVVNHNLGILPVIKCELPDHLWVANLCSTSAIEHLRLSCHRFDFLTQALLQRFYKTVQKPDGDFSSSYSDNSSPKVGLEYINELENFQYAEPQGTIVEHIKNTLDEIEDHIRSSVDLAGASGSVSKGVLQQSGISKELDYTSLSESLKTYGAFITDWLQDIYQLVERFKGGDYESISVSGLDSFEVDSVGTILSRLDTISKIDIEALKTNLPNYTFTKMLEKLSLALSPNISSEDVVMVKNEILEMTSQNPQISE